jgi:hypothetical protein
MNSNAAAPNDQPFNGLQTVPVGPYAGWTAEEVLAVSPRLHAQAKRAHLAHEKAIARLEAVSEALRWLTPETPKAPEPAALPAIRWEDRCDTTLLRTGHTTFVLQSRQAGRVVARSLDLAGMLAAWSEHSRAGADSSSPCGFEADVLAVAGDQLELLGALVRWLDSEESSMPERLLERVRETFPNFLQSAATEVVR